MRYFIELSYNGKNYHGWQIQPNAISVQEVLEKALSTLLRVKTGVVGAGRTDTGVHASQIFAHFDTDKLLDVKEFTYKLNAILPKTIVVEKVFRVTDDAHARFHATNRSYEYKIITKKNPFLHEYTHLMKLSLDVEKIPDGKANRKNLYPKIEGKYMFIVTTKKVETDEELTANYNLYTYPKTGIGIQAF